MPFGGSVSRPVVRNSPGDSGGLLIQLLNECLDYASGVGKGALEQMAELLDELERAVDEMFQTGQARFFAGNGQPRLLVREAVLRSNFHSYVAYKLAMSPDDYFASFEASPLFVALRPPLRGTEMLTMLLGHGLDPNQVSRAIPESTPWVAFINRASLWSHQLSGSRAFFFALKRGLFSEFLAHGADPNARHSDTGLTVFAMYLLTASKFQLESDTIEAYLRTFDDFLDAGANLVVPVANASSFYDDSPSFRLDDSMERGSTITLWKAFCRWLTSRATLHLEKQKLIASIIEKLITRGSFNGEGKRELEGAVQVLLPLMAPRLLKLAEGPDSEPVARKRKFQNEVKGRKRFKKGSN